MGKIIILFVALMLAFPLVAKEDKGDGGVRAEHASDMGMEKGKAWAGSKEKKVKDEKEEKAEKEEKEKKEKKAKKAKKK